MAATEVDLANAVVTELNDAARAWTGAFTAVRKWLPVWDDDDHVSLRCWVTPMTLETAKLARTKQLFSYGITIDLAKYIVDQSTNTEIDALVITAEQVHDYFRINTSVGNRHLPSPLSEWWIEDCQRPELFIEEALNIQNLWWTYFELTVRNQR